MNMHEQCRGRGVTPLVVPLICMAAVVYAFDLYGCSGITTEGSDCTGNRIILQCTGAANNHQGQQKSLANWFDR